MFQAIIDCELRIEKDLNTILEGSVSSIFVQDTPLVIGKMADGENVSRGERGEGKRGPVPVAQERAREDEACTASEGARSVKGERVKPKTVEK